MRESSCVPSACGLLCSLRGSRVASALLLVAAVRASQVGTRAVPASRGFDDAAPSRWAGVRGSDAPDDGCVAPSRAKRQVPAFVLSAAGEAAAARRRQGGANRGRAVGWLGTAGAGAVCAPRWMGGATMMVPEAAARGGGAPKFLMLLRGTRVGGTVGHRTMAGMASGGGADGDGGDTRVTVLVRGEEVVMDDKALRQAVEQSDEESVVTVRISVLNSLGSMRLDRLLSESIPILSRSSLSRIIKAEGVTLNDKVPKPSAKLKRGDDVIIHLPPPPSSDVEGEDIPLSILFEDDQVALVNKQPDLVVHPAPTAPSGTLVNALVHHFQHGSGEGGLSTVGSDKARPGIVHRLDRNTSGVMVVAKTEGAHWSLYEQFARRSTDKRYLALVQGSVTPPRGIIDMPLGRHPRDPTKFAVQEDGGGKESQTEYVVREAYKGYSLLEVKLLTGRTHQIRVHLSYLNHALVGDTVYGGKPLLASDIASAAELKQSDASISSSSAVILGRQALHSSTLRFQHPVSDEHHTILAPAPYDFARAVHLLRQHRLIQVADPSTIGAKIPMGAIVREGTVKGVE